MNSLTFIKRKLYVILKINHFYLSICHHCALQKFVFQIVYVFDICELLKHHFQLEMKHVYQIQTGIIESGDMYSYSVSFSISCFCYCTLLPCTIELSDMTCTPLKTQFSFHCFKCLIKFSDLIQQQKICTLNFITFY